MPAKSDLQNKVFGRLTALRDTGARKDTSVVWECLCSCGKLTETTAHSLKRGATRSCGCLRAELGVAIKKHGKSSSPEYGVWEGMIARCGNKDRPNFHLYGGRGIAVCDRWKSFENFFADMGLKPSAGWSLDRIDNEQGYSPENCRWATRAEQSRNMRRNVWVEIEGRRMILKDACDLLQLPYKRVEARRRKCGWTTEEALELI